jgi:hypothetical protein
LCKRRSIKEKVLRRTDETCKENIVQMEEKDEKNPIETAHVPNPLGR